MDFTQALKILTDVVSQVNANLATHTAMQQALTVIQEDHDRLVGEATAAVEQEIKKGMRATLHEQM